MKMYKIKWLVTNKKSSVYICNNFFVISHFCNVYEIKWQWMESVLASTSNTYKQQSYLMKVFTGEKWQIGNLLKMI